MFYICEDISSLNTMYSFYNTVNVTTRLQKQVLQDAVPKQQPKEIERRSTSQLQIIISK